MERFTKAWPCWLSAALLLLAFPPFNLGFLALVALVPWFASLKGLNGKQAFRSGCSFGLLYMGGQFVWLFLFVQRWTQSVPMALVPTIACTLAACLYFGLSGWLIAIAWRRDWIWSIPFLWCGVEVFRSFIPGLAFPWGLIHTPFYPYAGLIQLAHFGTAFAVSGWIVLGNVVATLCLLKESQTRVRPYVLVFLVLGVASWVRYTSPMSGQAKSIVIAQPGVDLAFGDPALEQAAILSSLVRTSEALAKGPKVDLVVFPEGIVDNQGQWPPIFAFEPAQLPPMIIGGQRRDQGKTFQAAYGFDGKWSFADKRRLVVFGEYVPLRDQLGFLKGFNLPSGDLTPSDKTTSVQVGGMKVGPMLCFEALFADVARDHALNGSQILTTMSVDDWYMRSPAPEQLMAGSVFRAIETGMPLARSATTGISICVDARGNILKVAPVGGWRLIEQELVVPDKPEYIPASWYAIWLFIASIVVVPLADRWLSHRESKR